MENITIAATDRSPEVAFNPQEGTMFLRGESYPEDAAGFFGPLLDTIEAYLAGKKDGTFQAVIEMIYFNSSSAKALMNMFSLMEDAAREGLKVSIEWRYRSDDDTMEEFGEDFSEDFESAEFKLTPID